MKNETRSEITCLVQLYRFPVQCLDERMLARTVFCCCCCCLFAWFCTHFSRLYNHWPISLHVIVIPTCPTHRTPKQQSLTYFISRHCHTNIVPHTGHPNNNHWPISLHVIVIPTLSHTQDTKTTIIDLFHYMSLSYQHCPTHRTLKQQNQTAEPK